ncbi:MAG: hypothetical protein PHS44_06580 [Candidatus Dojkabacteria bacterium]|nr:hypothetical protein [Candidatus Dojkabacteria bacterium]
MESPELIREAATFYTQLKDDTALALQSLETEGFSTPRPETLPGLGVYYPITDPSIKPSSPTVLHLVGSSCSGKTTLGHELFLKDPLKSLFVEARVDDVFFVLREDKLLWDLFGAYPEHSFTIFVEYIRAHLIFKRIAETLSISAPQALVRKDKTIHPILQEELRIIDTHMRIARETLPDEYFYPYFYTMVESYRRSFEYDSQACPEKRIHTFLIKLGLDIDILTVEDQAMVLAISQMMHIVTAEEVKAMSADIARQTPIRIGYWLDVLEIESGDRARTSEILKLAEMLMALRTENYKRAYSTMALDPRYDFKTKLGIFDEGEYNRSAVFSALALLDVMVPDAASWDNFSLRSLLRTSRFYGQKGWTKDIIILFLTPPETTLHRAGRASKFIMNPPTLEAIYYQHLHLFHHLREESSRVAGLIAIDASKSLENTRKQFERAIESILD